MISEPNIDIAAGIPCARKTEKTYIVKLDEDGNGVTMNGMGLVRAQRVATAFMMIKREVIEKLIKDNPQWNYWDNKTERTLSAIFDFAVKDNSYVGEDYLFCDRARAAGFQVWVDPTDTKFSFLNSSNVATDANGIYAINIARNRFREKMDAAIGHTAMIQKWEAEN